MKRFLSVAIILCFIAGTSRADEGKPMTDQGTHAILFLFQGLSSFGVGGLFNVGYPSQYTVLQGQTEGAQSGQFIPSATSTVPGIGMKYFIANNMALRGGIGLGYASTSTPNNQTSLSANTQSGLLLGIQAILEYHFGGLGALSPYVSGGLGFTTASISSKNYQSANNEQDLSNSTSIFGVLVGAGFEWFFANHISLGAEYQIGFSSTSATNEDKTTSGSNTTDKKNTLPSYTNLSSNSFSLVLSLYP